MSALQGKAYPSERQFFTDEITGAKITRLTCFPTVNSKFYFHINQFTPDSKTLVFTAYREAGRASFPDVFKVNVDGTDLTQLTDCATVSAPFLSYSGQYLYYMDQNKLVRVDINRFDEEIMTLIPGVKGPSGCMSLTLDDKTAFVDTELCNGRMGIVRIATDTGEASIIYEGEKITHTQVEPIEGKTVAFQYGPDDKGRNIWLMDSDGKNPRVLDLPHGNGHWMWLCQSKQIMTNLESCCWGIACYGEGEKQVKTIISSDEHFWHASCSRDGKWIVSDTNWPDHGIKLIHAESKKCATLCLSQSSNAHPQWTHPHPSFSPDGRFVVYNSDMTGIPHVHLVEISDAFKASFIS